MELIITIIAASIVLGIVWAAFIYLIEIRDKQKLLDEYITRKHKRKARVKKHAFVRKPPGAPVKEAKKKEQQAAATAPAKTVLNIEQV